MAQVLVRNLDDGVVETFRRRAAANGRSLEQELRLVLTSAATPTPAERLAIVDAIRAPPRAAGPDTTTLVREDRDR